MNSFLLSLHLRYHEIPRKEEIYSYITIIIRVLGNLIHKCTSIILRLFGISDSATLNRRHHWKNSLHSGTIEQTAKSWRQLQKISYLFTVVCILATHGDSGDSISSRNKILFLCYSYRHMWPFCSSLCRIHNRTCEIVRETPQSNSIKHLELNKWLR